MDKNEVCVLISDEIDLRNAEIMLMSYNEPIARDGTFRYTGKGSQWNYLKYSEMHGSWYLGRHKGKKVSLLELEEILK